MSALPEPQACMQCTPRAMSRGKFNFIKSHDIAI